METGFLTILVSPLNLFKARTNYRYTCRHPPLVYVGPNPTLTLRGWEEKQWYRGKACGSINKAFSCIFCSLRAKLSQELRGTQMQL